MENNKEEIKTEIRLRKALSFGWSKTRQRLLFFVAVSFIFVFLSILVTLPLDIIAEYMEGTVGFLIAIASTVIYLAFQMFLTAGFLTILLKTLREEGPSFKDFFNKQRYIIRLAVGYLLYSIVVLIGFVFLIIPGIFLASRLHFFDFLIIDKDMRPVEALKKSYEITKGYTWKIFLLLFVAAPFFFILGAMAFFVGILVAAPVIFLAQAFFYGRLLESDSNLKEKLSQV